MLSCSALSLKFSIYKLNYKICFISTNEVIAGKQVFKWLKCLSIFRSKSMYFALYSIDLAVSERQMQHF